MSEKKKCVFCRIADGEEPGTELLFQDDNFVVFRDRKPATTHHYLVVPKSHRPDAKRLEADDIEMVKRMVSIGNEVLEKEGGNDKGVRMGFHWPPFHSISHLHLHVISSPESMGWIARAIFKPNSIWFVTVDWLLDRLEKMKVHRPT